MQNRKTCGSISSIARNRDQVLPEPNLNYLKTVLTYKPNEINFEPDLS